MKVNRIEGYNLLISKILIQYVVETLRHDSKLGPFEYLAGESTLYFNYSTANGLHVKTVCIFDRIDKLCSDGTLRIVDYKTGGSQKGNKLLMNEIPQLFISEGKGSAEAFQVMFYCLMLMNANPYNLKKLHLDKVPEHMAPHLYFIRDFKEGHNVSTCLFMVQDKVKEDVSDFVRYAEEFKKDFDKLITDIFDPMQNFTQCEDDHHCKYCAFASYCQR